MTHFPRADYEKRKSVPSFVDRIFGGELTSTIMCDECRTVSGGRAADSLPRPRLPAVLSKRLHHSCPRGRQAPFAAGSGPLDIEELFMCPAFRTHSSQCCVFQRLGPATHPTIWCLQWTFSFLLRFLFWLVKVSLVHESFLDLSLPVLDDQVRLLSSSYLSRSFSCVDFMGEPCHLLRVYITSLWRIFLK